MYNLLEKKSDIQHFKAIGNDLLFKVISNDYSLFKNDILFDDENYGYFQFEKYICLNHKGSTDFIDLISNQRFSIPVTFTGNGFFNNNFIISKNSLREGVGLYSSNYVICQLFPYEELYELPHRYYGSGYRYRNHYFQVHKERKLLKSLSLLTGEYEWEVDLGAYGEIRKIIGVLGDMLWVSVNDAEYGHHHLLALNIHSGEVIKAFKKDQTFADFGVLLYEDRQTIVSLFGRISLPSWFYEYDALTGEALRALEVPALKEQKLGVRSFTVYKNHIYFTATDDNQIVANTVGVLDYDTLDLLWHQKVEPGDLLLDPPQVTDTHLYVLGAEGTLHIFEKEGSDSVA